MTPAEFVQCFRREKDFLLNLYLDPASGSPVSSQLALFGNDPNVQSEVLNTILTDAFYTILLSLDGCASLGGVQQAYTIRDEEGSILCDGSGSIEALAGQYFPPQDNT